MFFYACPDVGVIIMDIASLRQRRAKHLEDARALIDKADAEKRDLTDEDRAAIQGHRTSAEALKADIGIREQQENDEKDLLRTTGRPVLDAPPALRDTDTPPPTKAPAVHRARYSGLAAFRGDGAEDRAYRSGMWLRATVFGDRAARKWCGESGIEIRTAQAEGTDYLGGYLVPEEFNTTIIDLRELYGVFRAQSDVYPMGSDTMVVPRSASDVTAYAIGENAAITESNVTWDQVRLTAKKWAVLNKVSSELAADAVINLADWLAQSIAWKFAYTEDICGFNGDGTSTYHGIYGAAVKIDDGTHTASVYDALAGNTAFSTLDLADFEGCAGSLPLYAEANAKWYISKVGFWASMARLADAAGGNTRDDIAGGAARQFLGYPVVFSQVLNTTVAADVSAVKCLFGDLKKASTMGVRGGVEIKVDDSRYMEYDQIAVRGIERFDINCHDLGDTSDAGPLVALKTPGA